MSGGEGFTRFCRGGNEPIEVELARSDPNHAIPEVM